MNIRKIGSYEIVLYDMDMKRIEEVVSHSSYWKSKEIAENMLANNDIAQSYTVAKILDNSKFNNWSPEQVQLIKSEGV